ncbi:hypothetical protein [Streptomyces sp. NPDC048361]|uniref:hypothetical protein n=1 Tax=Streptomyces sp. NPDC048361 TaxID=3154720 RepID=UPI00342BCCAA
MTKLPITLHQAALGAETFKVIRSGQPTVRAVLLDQDRYLGAYLDQDAAYQVAGLWELAASSPRALIHLPLRKNSMPSLELPCTGRPLDLVLLHHSLHFAPSRWKEVRARLGPARPRTLTLPTGPHPAEDTTGLATRHHKENRDLFHQRVHADTLFMTGSATLFAETARRFHDLARNGPVFAPGPATYRHYCTELHSSEGLLDRRARELHIEYCDQWSAA